MRSGTRSLLFGVHQFLLHPLFVLLAWFWLFGLPPAGMLLAIILHDWGYWGCESMEGHDGSRHPWFAARLLYRLHLPCEGWQALCHSRFLAAELDAEMSDLGRADKIGTALYPVWLWVLLARFSGEAREYMADKKFEINSESRAESASEFFGRYKKFAMEKWGPK